MVVISSQYSFGADKAVQISHAIVFNKGTPPELGYKNCKLTLLIWITWLLYERLDLVQTFVKFQYCSTFYAHTAENFVVKF